MANRSRAAALLALTSVLAKIGGLLVTVFTIPPAYAYLGPEAFGVWMTLSSFIGLLAFLDLGIGNGLIGALAAARAQGDARALNEIVSSAYACVLAVAALLAAAILPFVMYADAGRIFRLTDAHGIHEATLATQVFAVLFIVNLLASLMQKVQWGLQEGYVASVWQLAGSLLAIASVPLAIAARQPLWVLVVCLFGSQVAGNLLNTVTAFVRDPGLRPRPSAARRDRASELLRLGLLFLVLQLAVAFAYQSDSLIIVRDLGPGAVSEYAIVQKLFQVVSVGLGTVLSSLWPAYSDAIARNDWPWIRKAFLSALAAAGACSVLLCTAVVLGFGWITSAWLGSGYQASTLLVATFAAWTVVDVLGNVTGTMLNGLNVVRFQVVVATLMAASAFALKLLWVPMIGLPGAVGATLCAYLIVSAPAQFVYVRRKIVLRHEPSP